MPIARRYWSNLYGGDIGSALYFVDAKPVKPEIGGIPVISERDFLEMDAAERFFNIAIANSALRERVSLSLINGGAKPLSIISLDSTIYDDAEIGEGSIVCGYCTITSKTRIGRFVHANIYSYVAHDCVIGNFVTFAPRVNCNGYTHVGDHAYIGTCAALRPGTPDKPLTVGEGTIIAMGAVVTRDVPPYATVVGSPPPARHIPNAK